MRMYTRVLSYLRFHLSETALLALCIILFISHTAYVAVTHQYPAGGLDEPVYVALAIHVSDLVRQNPLLHLREIWTADHNRQPLYPVLISIPVVLFGTGNAYKHILWFNIIFYLITVISIYKLGTKFYSKLASFLASAVFAWYGFPLFYLHFAYSETAVTAAIMLTAVFLYESKSLTDRKYTVLTALSFVAASLIRWVAPIFIAGPFVVSVYSGIRHAVHGKRQGLARTLTGLAIFFVIGVLGSVLLYYGPNLGNFRGYVMSNVSNGSRWSQQFLGVSGSVLSVHSVMYYFNILSEQGIYFWLLFFVGFFVCVAQYRKYAYLLAGFIVPYLVFTFSTTWKGDRFILPIYPFMALISVSVIDGIHTASLRRLVITLTLIIGALNFLGGSWGIGPLGKQGLKDIVLPSFIPHPRRIYVTSMVWPPRPNEANVDRIVQSLLSSWKSKSKPFVFTLTFYMPQVQDGLSEVLFQERRGLASEIFLYHQGVIPKNQLITDLMQADYILVKEGVVDGRYKPTDEPTSREDMQYIYLINDAYRMAGNTLPAGYSITGRIAIPFDGSHVIIYKKVGNVTADQWLDFLAVSDRFIELQ